MEIIIFLILAFYIIAWACSTVILLDELNTEHGYKVELTKAEVKTQLIIPFYKQLKTAYLRYKSL